MEYWFIMKYSLLFLLRWCKLMQLTHYQSVNIVQQHLNAFVKPQFLIVFRRMRRRFWFVSHEFSATVIWSTWITCNWCSVVFVNSVALVPWCGPLVNGLSSFDSWWNCKPHMSRAARADGDERSLVGGGALPALGYVCSNFRLERMFS